MARRSSRTGPFPTTPKSLTPELAESWEVTDDGKTYVFHLRKDATFHDGAPVTAKDVKWSFDRAIAAGGFAAVQMGAGSMVKPEQFSVIDDHTFKATFDQYNKLTMPDLVVPIPTIVNSELAKKHATDKDPWAFDWVSHNDCGGGAFKVESWTPGQQTIFTRFDDWKSGPLPKLKRVIYKQIPSAGTRRALLEKGDVDMSVGLPPKDYAELAKEGKVQVIGVPIQNDLVFIDMNVKIAPFDNPKVREAISYAIPYKEIINSALYNRAKPMFGGDPDKPYPEGVWPVPLRHGQDLAKAKQLLTEAGFPDGFKTTLSYRPQRGDGARADRNSDSGGVEEDRRRPHAREGAGVELVRADGEQDDADGHRRVLWLARLSGLFLLLDL